MFLYRKFSPFACQFATPTHRTDMTLQPDLTDIRRDLVSLLPRLRRFALALCGQPDMVDELVGDACLLAVLKAPHFESGSRLESWAFSLIHSVWLEQSKKRKQSSDEAAAHNGFAGYHAILDLPDGTATSFLLVCVEDHTYAESAAILGIAAETVAANVVSARRHFSAQVADNAERRA
jgi:RNA polymerase sigma-70 factor (ECF subfamily)